MSIWNKVLLVLIALTTAAFVVFASNRFNLEKDWTAKIAAKEKELANVLAQVSKLQEEIYGSPLNSSQEWDDLSLTAQLHRIRSLFNGVVWVNCEALNLAQNGTKVTSSFMLPSQYDYNGVRQSGLVYLFDTGTPFVANDLSTAVGSLAKTDEDVSLSSNPATFLGVFQIDRINRSEISLSSVVTMSKDEVDALNKSVKARNSWFVVPDRLPIDSPDTFVAWKDSSPAFIESLTSGDKEFFDCSLLDFDELATLPLGKTVSADGQSRVPLDFSFLCRNGFTRRDELNVALKRKNAALSDMNSVVIAQRVALGTDLPANIITMIDSDLYNQAKQANLYPTYQEVKEDRTNRLASMEMQRDLVKDRLAVVTDYQKKMQDRIDDLLRKNNELAVAIAQTQFQALKKILNRNAGNTEVYDNGVSASNTRNYGDI